MKHMSYIRKILRPIYGSKQDNCTIDVLDYSQLSLGRKCLEYSSLDSDTLTIVAAIMKNNNKDRVNDNLIDNSLFVFWLENYETVVKDLLLSKTTHLENLGFVYTQNSDKTSKTILKSELWSLNHDNSVISASFKKNYDTLTPFNRLFLVTLTKSYMAYIWRFNELQDSFEICIQIPLQTTKYDLYFQCLWINIESSVIDYNFSSRAFLMFYNTTSKNYYSILSSDQDSKEYDDEINSGYLTNEKILAENLVKKYFDSLNLNNDLNLSSTNNKNNSNINNRNCDSNLNSNISNASNNSSSDINGTIKNDEDDPDNYSPQEYYQNVHDITDFNQYQKDNENNLGYDNSFDLDSKDSSIAGKEDNILFGKYDDYVQYFEIYGIDGLYNYQLVVTSEYLVGSNEISMPIKIKSIESVSICNHTFETGLVTLYTSDTLRPNKITTKFPIVVSKWITLKSTNLASFHSPNSKQNDYNNSNKDKNRNANNNNGRNGLQEYEDKSTKQTVDEVIGMQISKGLNKIMPPIKLNVMNENEISMNLLLSPYDLFLKDEHIKESVDNIVGLVIRYMFHASTPLYLNINDEFVYIENYFINKIKNSKKVKNVKVFSDKDETLYIIHFTNGTLTAITSKKHDPNDITQHKIHNLNYVSTFQVFEYHHQLYFIVFTPYSKENNNTYGTSASNSPTVFTRYVVSDEDVEKNCEDGLCKLYNCGFYKWENYKLNLKGNWLFRSPPRKVNCISKNNSNNNRNSDSNLNSNNNRNSDSNLNSNISNSSNNTNDSNNKIYINEYYDESDDEKICDAILHFKKWYDSNYFCLLSKFHFVMGSSSENSEFNLNLNLTSTTNKNLRNNMGFNDMNKNHNGLNNYDENDEDYYSPQEYYQNQETQDSNFDHDQDDVVYLYMIKKNKIIKWLEINNNCYYDLLTNNKYYIVNNTCSKEYSIGDLSILVKNKFVDQGILDARDCSDSMEMMSDSDNEVVYELPLFIGCNFKNKMFPIYHPESVLSMLKLGLNTLVSKLINMLVFVFRKILNQLKNDTYCINSNPYDQTPKLDTMVGGRNLGNNEYNYSNNGLDNESQDSNYDDDQEEDNLGSCNCIIFKTLTLKLFCKFNRFFYDYVVKNIFNPSTHTSHFNYTPSTSFTDEKDNNEDERNLLHDYVVDDEYNEYFNEYCSFKQDNQLLVGELVVYLQVIRLIGLTWYEQYQLINILVKYYSSDDDLLLFTNNEELEKVVEKVESEINGESDDEGTEGCKLCNNANMLLNIAMEQSPQIVMTDNNVLKYLMGYLTTLSTSSSYYNTYNTNKNVTDLDNIFLGKFKDNLNNYVNIKKEQTNEGTTEGSQLMSSCSSKDGYDPYYDELSENVIWLLLVKNDQNLLNELNDYYTATISNQTNKDGQKILDYMEYLDLVHVGYWLKNKSGFKTLFDNVDKHFKLKVKGYRNVEDFDHFGFFLILQGKVNIFSLLVKSKGFEKFANFLTNDFTQERWKDASVKNAFALISQRRYLLSSAMLILANRIQDAIDVIHQYLNNTSLCVFVAKLFDFDLLYVFKRIQNPKIRYVLFHTHSIDTDSYDELFLSYPSKEEEEVNKKPESKGSEEEEDDLSKQVELLCNQENDTNKLVIKDKDNTSSNTNNKSIKNKKYKNNIGIKDSEESMLELLTGHIDELILNVSIGIVLKKLDLLQVEQMIRNSSRYYLDKMPIISVLLHSLLTNYTSWDKILLHASNFLHFQKFNNFNQKYDYLDFSNQGISDSYCNNTYYVDDYKYLDGNVLVEFNNFTFKQPDNRCPLLKTLSSIIPSMNNPKPVKQIYQGSSLMSFSGGLLNQYGQSIEDMENMEYLRSKDELFLMNDDNDLIVNVNTLSVVESLLKIKSNLNMELTLTHYKINSNISIKKYDLDIESIYIRLVNTFIGFLDSNLQVENFNIPSLLINLIDKLSLLTIYSCNLTTSDEKAPTNYEEKDMEEIKMERANRLDVGLYDTDLKLLNEEIVCICFVVSLSCIFVLMLYKVDTLTQVYNGLYTQLSLLNQMKGNTKWLSQFLESVIKTIEPSLFTNSIYNINEFNILNKKNTECVSSRSLNRSTRMEGKDDEEDLHEFIGIIMTLSILETILGLMRNYIYKQTNYYHYFWLDRLSLSISRYLFNYKDQLIMLSLKSSKTMYKLNYNYHNAEGGGSYSCRDATKFSDHEDIVNNYLLANYSNSFYKLWSYLNCNYKLYSLYSNNHNINPYRSNDPSPKSGRDTSKHNKDDKYYDEKDDYNELYNILDNYRIINYENLLIPLIMPLKLIFYKLYYYSNHQIYLNNSTNTTATGVNKEDSDLLKNIVDILRKIRFISLHNAKGRTLSTFYSMPNITMNEHLNHLSLQLLVEPIKSDLYLLTELNTNLSVYQLSNSLTNNFIDLLIEYNERPNKMSKETHTDDNWIILLKFLKYLNNYSNVYIEEQFNIKMSNLKVSEKLQVLLKSKDSNNSGGISPHPMWPLYAVAHGSSSDKYTPSYTISMQHSQVLSNEFRYAKNYILLNNLIDITNVSTLQLNTFHSSNMFGDLLYIDWSGDSLCLYDKFGWILLYYMKNLLYTNSNGQVTTRPTKNDKDQFAVNTIPTLCFKTHFASNYVSWLGEYFILTMGYGILQESIEPGIIYINLTIRDHTDEVDLNGDGLVELSQSVKNMNLSQNAQAMNGSTDFVDEKNYDNAEKEDDLSKQVELFYNQENDTNKLVIKEMESSIDFEDKKNRRKEKDEEKENKNKKGKSSTSKSESNLKCIGRESISMQGLNAFSENSYPCICIWNLVEYNNNNIPMIKILLSFGNSPNSNQNDYNGSNTNNTYISSNSSSSSKDQGKDDNTRITTILKIKNHNISNGSKEVGLDFDLFLFDSQGVLRVFSVTDMNIVLACKLENTGIVSSFLLLNGNFVTVSDDGKIKVYKIIDLYTKPVLIFDTMATVVEPKETASSTSLVTTIGEFISQRFTREKPQQVQQPIKIVNVRLYSRQFISIVYSDEQVSITQLPNFTVY